MHKTAPYNDEIINGVIVETGFKPAHTAGNEILRVCHGSMIAFYYTLRDNVLCIGFIPQGQIGFVGTRFIASPR